MHFIRYIFAPLLSFGLLASCSLDESSRFYSTETNYEVSLNKNASIAHNTSKVLEQKTILDYQYGKNPKQVCDIYLPKGRTFNKTKVLVLLHGGGWINGDKAGMKKYIKEIQQRNPRHAIVNMNYRLANENTYAFPNQFNDLQLLLQDLKNNARDFQINPEFGLIGASAGAHIAMMYDYTYDQEDAVKFVCSMVGPTDFTHSYYQNRPDFQDLLNLLVDPTVYQNISENVEVLSPAHQVSNMTSPTIMFYGENDPLVPIENAYVLNEKLDFFNIEKDLMAYSGGHNNWADSDYKNLHNTLSTFIEEHLPIN